VSDFSILLFFLIDCVNLSCLCSSLSIVLCRHFDAASSEEKGMPPMFSSPKMDFEDSGGASVPSSNVEDCRNTPICLT
jgi:hypothetical protein